ncbi:MAG: hypothetical protein HRU32_06690 [Rhodobacteraceae bacterium]|nr:hypothetical protein [Paracoccaceae bacterium]
MLWTMWWVWLCAAVVLAVLEVLIPGYVLLGFAIGASITGIVLFVGGPFAGFLTGSMPLALIFFAVLSLISWLILRRMLGVREGQVKTFDRDINED